MWVVLLQRAAWARIFSVAWDYCVISHTPRRPYEGKRYNKRKHDCWADICAVN
ncbi:hypothetical protein Aeq9CBH6_15980 [Adlercreutzia equolifaciens]|nr:hypothetical protein Aeq9CBH6_15980 [Adlercreutzia equolifaciens]